MILSDHVVISQCVGDQLTYNGVICSGNGMVKTEYLDNDACCLTEEKDRKHLANFATISLFIHR